MQQQTDPSKALLFRYNSLIASGIFQYKENYVPPSDQITYEFVINNETERFLFRFLECENAFRNTNFRFQEAGNKSTNKQLYNFEYFVSKVTFPDLKGGNILQRLQRFFWGEYDLKPKMRFGAWRSIQKTNPEERTIALCLDHLPKSAETELIKFCQTTNLSVKLFSETKNHAYYFAESFCSLAFENQIKELINCEYFIGNEKSAFTHYAAVNSLNMITVTEIPGDHCYFPLAINQYFDMPSALVYPQSVVLCCHGSNEIVPQLSSKNISDAIHGYIYPYFSDTYLNLIKLDAAS